MNFYPDDPQKLVHKSGRYRCPHCGENSYRKYMRLDRWVDPEPTSRFINNKRFKCGLCDKYSYRAHNKKRKQSLVITIISLVFCVVILGTKELLFYKSGLGVHPFSHQPFNLEYALYWGVFIAILPSIFYIRNKFKLPGWRAWQTSEDGTPAPGRRIKVKFDNEPRFEKVVKDLAIYDVEPVGKGGLIYAQCEQVSYGTATLRIIKCKGYNAPVGDEIKIIDGKKSVIGTIYDQTELPTHLENNN